MSLRSTYTRSAHRQTWPVFRKTESVKPLTVSSKSQSAKMMAAFLPPSSNDTGFTVGATARMIAEPVRDSPVNVIASTPGWVVRNSPAESGPKPWTTLKTPAGTPAVCITSASNVAVAGVSSEKFDDHTIAAGQRRSDFPGEQQQRQVPWRDNPHDAERLADRVIEGDDAVGVSVRNDSRPVALITSANARKFAAPRGTSMRDASEIGFPVSATSACRKSWKPASMPSAILCSSAARLGTGKRPQSPRKLWRAAATASSTWPRPASETWAITEPSAGFKSANSRAPRTKRPLM